MSTSIHLTEAQIDDALIGDLAVGPAAHLAECDPCQVSVAEAGAPIASFKAVSLAWSERHSATMPSKIIPVAAPLWKHRTAWTAAAAMLVLAVAIPLRKQPDAHDRPVATVNQPSRTELSQSSTQQPVVVVPAPQPTSAHAAPDQQIAKDNQMLQAIDRELDASIESPSVAFDLAPGNNPSSGQGHYAPAPAWD